MNTIIIKALWHFSGNISICEVRNPNIYINVDWNFNRSSTVIVDTWQSEYSKTIKTPFYCDHSYVDNSNQVIADLLMVTPVRGDLSKGSQASLQGRDTGKAVLWDYLTKMLQRVWISLTDDIHLLNKRKTKQTNTYCICLITYIK